MTMLELEQKASKSEMSVDDFKIGLWFWCLNKTNKKHINKLARGFNVYPTGPNVYQAVCEDIFKGIAIEY